MGFAVELELVGCCAAELAEPDARVAIGVDIAGAAAEVDDDAGAAA